MTGFVGAGVYSSADRGEGSETLMKRMGQYGTVKHSIDLTNGRPRHIADGPFKELEGKVSEIDEDRGKVKVLVSCSAAKPRSSSISCKLSLFSIFWQNKNIYGKKDN